MRAIVLEKTGKPEVLKVKDVPTPDITNQDELIVKLSYAGVNYADILSRKGQYSWAPKRPYVPGLEGYGIIEKVGNNVKNYHPGDKVIVVARNGTYAEYIKVTEEQIIPAVDFFSPEQNAAFAASYMTSMVGLYQMARVRPREKILVQAAAGALGIATVQLAKAMGLKVAGTASRPEKISFLKEKLEIDLAINYVEKDFRKEIMQWTNNRGVDVVLESVGGKVFKNSIDCLSPMGRIVVVGATSINYSFLNPFSLIKAWRDIPRINVIKMIRNSYGVLGLHLGWLFTKDKEELMPIKDQLLKIIKNNKIAPVIDTIFPLEKIAEAHRRIETRKNIGKIIIKIG